MAAEADRLLQSDQESSGSIQCLLSVHFYDRHSIAYNRTPVVKMDWQQTINAPRAFVVTWELPGAFSSRSGSLARL